MHSKLELAPQNNKGQGSLQHKNKQATEAGPLSPAKALDDCSRWCRVLTAGPALQEWLWVGQPRGFLSCSRNVPAPMECPGLSRETDQHSLDTGSGCGRCRHQWRAVSPDPFQCLGKAQHSQDTRLLRVLFCRFPAGGEPATSRFPLLQGGCTGRQDPCSETTHPRTAARLRGPARGCGPWRFPLPVLSTSRPWAGRSG